MRPRKGNLLLALLAVSVLSGCRPSSHQETQEPSVTPLATVNFTPAVPTQILPTAELSCKPSASYGLAIGPSMDMGQCDVYVSAQGYGYRLKIPADWNAELAGATAANLWLNRDSSTTDLPVFVLFTVSYQDLPIEQLDALSVGYEMSPAIPIVKPDEKQVVKQLTMVGSHETANVMSLRTATGEYEIQRYFLPFKNRQYCKDNQCVAVLVFEVRFSLSTGEPSAFLRQVEDVIASARFLVRPLDY